MARFKCPRCKVTDNWKCTGDSSLYKAEHVLCEQCFLDEWDEIEERGTNDIPERLESYGSPNAYD